MNIKELGSKENFMEKVSNRDQMARFMMGVGSPVSLMGSEDAPIQIDLHMKGNGN